MLSRRTLLLSLIFVGLVSAVWVVGCSRAPDPWRSEPAPHVLVSVPPLYSFAKSVTGEQGSVRCLCTETGPHHFEFSPTDLLMLRGATRYFTVGLNLDDKFSDKMMKATEVKPDIQVELGEKLPKELKHAAVHEHDEKDAKKHDHEHGDFDPHVWLGSAQAIVMVETIRDELKEADPANKADYDKNAAKYIGELKELHAYGEKLLKDKANKRILSFHDSLRYFAKDYGIEIVDVIEEIPANEPDATKILELVQKCKKEQVRFVAVEPQYPTSTAATVLQRELKKQGIDNVVLVEIDPLETALEKDLTADLYIKTMRANLENLAKSLP